MSSAARTRDHQRAVIERRQSNAPGTHADRRTRRNRDRAAQRRNAIRQDSA